MKSFRLSPSFQALLITALCLLVYYPSFSAGTTSLDDARMIDWVFNHEWPGLRQIFFPGGGTYYRPLVFLTYYLDKFLWMFEPSFMHLENVLVHLGNSLLVFKVAQHFLPNGKNGVPAMAAALLFSLHPINTESVNWISGRTDLLAGFFVLAAFWVFLRALEMGGALRYALSAVLFVLAVLSKETALLWFPGVLLVTLAHNAKSNVGLVNTLRKCTWPNFGFPTLVVGAGGLVYALLRNVAMSHKDIALVKTAAVLSPMDTAHVAYTLNDKIVIAVKAYGFYVKKLIVPFPLNFAITHISDVYLLVGLVSIALSIWMVWRLRPATALMAMAIGFFLPAIIVAIGHIAWTPLAERYLYLSSMPFSIAIVLIVTSVRSRYAVLQTPTFAGCALVMVLFSVGTFGRNLVWQSNLSLYRDAYEKSPDFPPVKYEYAVALQKAGEQTLSQQLLDSLKKTDERRFDIQVSIVRARNLIESGDWLGARKELLSPEYESGVPYFDSYVDLRLKVNAQLVTMTTNDRERQRLRDESLQLVEILLSNQKDPFNAYRLGQFRLNFGDVSGALEKFQYAAEHAPPGAHYRLAAQKLAKKLQGEDR